MVMESWVVYATNVCRRDGDFLLRTDTLEDELHTGVPLLLKTKLTSILPPCIKSMGEFTKICIPFTNVLKKYKHTYMSFI